MLSRRQPAPGYPASVVMPTPAAAQLLAKPGRAPSPRRQPSDKLMRSIREASVQSPLRNPSSSVADRMRVASRRGHFRNHHQRGFDRCHHHTQPSHRMLRRRFVMRKWHQRRLRTGTSRSACRYRRFRQWHQYFVSHVSLCGWSHDPRWDWKRHQLRPLKYVLRFRYGFNF